MKAWHSKWALCIDCGHEWVASYEEGTPEHKLECSKCGHRNSVITPIAESDDE